MATTKLMTAEDLYEMEDHGGRNELIRGELHEMPPTGDEHGEISATITILLGSHIREHKLGTVYAAETGFVISRDPDVVLTPDVAFVRAERLPADRDRRKFVPTVPDLVVEVISPSDRYGDVDDKVEIYLDSGVQVVWTVNPRQQNVTVHSPDHTTRTLTIDDTLDGSDVLPDFKLPVAEIFS